MNRINQLMKILKMSTFIVFGLLVIILIWGLALVLGNMADKKIDRLERIIKAFRATYKDP